MFCLQPDHKLKKIWDLAICFVTVLVAIYFPVSVVFEFKLKGLFLLIEIVIVFLYVFDLFLSLNTSFFKRMNLITDKKLIFRHYLKNGFFWDLLACIPFELLLGNHQDILLASPFYVLRILRIMKIFTSYRKVQKNVKINPSVFRLISLFVFVIVLGNGLACIWLMIGNIKANGLTIWERNTNAYIQSFYWVMTTLTTIGYGDLTPDKTNTWQMSYVIFMEIVGVAFYGLVVGNIASLIANVDIAKYKHKEKVNQINSFMKYHNVPKGLYDKINDYYAYLWDRRHGSNETSLIEDLPLSLRQEVTVFLNRDIIEKVPFFKGASSEFLDEIILALEPRIYLPKDEIVKLGEIGTEMYFIRQGSVSVLSPVDQTVIATLTEGQFFGEMALLLKSPRTADILANEYCDIYSLDKKKFNAILKNYPRFKDSMVQMAEKRKKQNIGKK